MDAAQKQKQKSAKYREGNNGEGDGAINRKLAY